MTDNDAKDNWGDGDAYENYMGRWSRLVAPEFIRWLRPEQDRAWLEIGCGTGALTASILGSAAPASVHATDPAAAHASHTNRRLSDPRATVTQASAGSLPARDGGYDYIVSGLVLNFIPDPAAAMAETIGLLRPGGTAAGYIWDYRGRMDIIRLFWAAAREVDSEAAGHDEDNRFDLGAEAALRTLFVDSGLEDVDVQGIEISMDFENFGAVWETLQGGQGPAPTYLAALGARQQAEFREALAHQMPAGPEGKVRLGARAWTARGRA